MAIKTMQKIVLIDNKKKDMNKIDSDLQAGWEISNMMPHEDGFLCILEKPEEDSGISLDESIFNEKILDEENSDDKIDLAKILSLTTTSNSKRKKSTQEYILVD